MYRVCASRIVSCNRTALSLARSHALATAAPAAPSAPAASFSTSPNIAPINVFNIWEHPELVASDHKSDVLVGSIGPTRALFLNRPKQLNALNLKMIRFLAPFLKGADVNESTLAVLVRGMGDKAFCAGGDVVALYKSGKSNGDVSTFFREEYKLNYQISQLQVPYIAVLNGITMGGGVGLSVHGRYRIATENSLFAMPETGIGFFPDVGGSYFLPRLQGSLGMYLALTGARLRGADLVHAGIATHFVSSADLGEFYRRFGDLHVPAAVHSHMEISSASMKNLPPFSLAPHLAAIDECFSGLSVEEIFESLRAHGTEWSDIQLGILGRMSPTSLKVTFEQMTRGAKLSLEECFQMEYRISQRFMKPGSDFYEGVRALLIDGDKKPMWEAKRLSDVTPSMVEEYFAPNEKDLKLGFLAPKQTQ